MPRIRLVLTVLFALMLSDPAARAECRLALVLALDVSRSVDAEDFAIQTGGLIAALQAPEVQTAFFAPAGDVALAVFQWSGDSHQEIVVDWALIRRPEDLAPVVAALEALRPPELRLSTAIGQALAFGRALLDRAPDCRRRVIDVSGDGRNNNGPTPERVYAGTDWAGITVNGLAIGAHEMSIERYYSEVVIRGPGAFVEMAVRQTDFPAAMRRKLQRELTEAFAALSPPDGGDSPPRSARETVDSTRPAGKS
ncbi:DUF1194 domain-containing protein [Neotabrizicola sp. VNH66]|uniref:DUF1194 domain-containing protein n=1 Tax=Neotabrizicola sp. VNH66 TaxID=3400918 RepID=UPI003C0CD170